MIGEPTKGRVLTVLVMAGGTGGHVFPALAVADYLRARGARIGWLGTQQGLEGRVVPEQGIEFFPISISGLRGKGLFALVLGPWRLLAAFGQALSVLRRFRPDSVLGMGGFVSGPGGLAAWVLRRPLVIHEQNAVPGLTNRVLARIASRVLEAFPGSFGSSVQALHTGNPLRGAIMNAPQPQERFAARSGPMRLLVIGGSQGAVALNRAVPAALATLPVENRPLVRHQAGVHNLESARAEYRSAGVEGEVTAFIDDMAAALAWADLVVCRSGAMTVAELAAVGVASVLIPFPHAVDDHQTGNAAYLVEAGGAVLLPEAELEPTRLAALLGDLLSGRERLLSMARMARAKAVADATARVARACGEVTDG